MSLLERIKDPSGIGDLSRNQLHGLVGEAREGHVDVIAKIGGHFGATMGVADLTVALHYAFDTPRLR